MSSIIAGVMKWGVWGSQLSIHEMAKLIDNCIKIGVTTFDHADIYGGHTTEAAFGKALQTLHLDRKDYRLISKCGIVMPSGERPAITLKQYNTNSDYIIASVEQSLRHLQTDYLDLLLIHRPSPIMQVDDIAQAVNSLKSSGKIVDFGVSNFTKDQVSLLVSYVDIAVNQIEMSVLHHQPLIDGTIDIMQLHKIRIQAWSPLGGGRLFSQQEDSRIDRLRNVALKYGWTMDEMAYLFLLHHPAGITPIVGSTKIERIKKAVTCANTDISDHQWFDIYTAALGHEVP